MTHQPPEAEPTVAQVAAAKALGISLAFVDSPIAIARVVSILADLKERVAELERQRKSWLVRK